MTRVTACLSLIRTVQAFRPVTCLSWKIRQSVGNLKSKVCYRKWWSSSETSVLLKWNYFFILHSKLDVRMSSFCSHCQVPVWWWVNEVIVEALLKGFTPLSVDCVPTPNLQYTMTNQFFALVLFDCACDMVCGKYIKKKKLIKILFNLSSNLVAGKFQRRYWFIIDMDLTWIGY